MEYKVCILAAGKNTQVSYAKDFTIALLPIGTKSALSKIIEKFPKHIEIVIAVGYNADLIKEFISIAHADRKITLIDIKDYDAPGSGPGTSLLACKDHLQCPFIFSAADTLVSESIPEPTKNWIGVAKVSESTPYCMAEVENHRVTKFYDKVETTTLLKTCNDYQTILNNAFVGLAGIHDFQLFWQALETNKQIIREEVQVSNGLSELIKQRIEAIPFANWFDIGNEVGYNFANRFFEKNRITSKADEFVYFENDKVIKYFADETVTTQRITRAKELGKIVPKITDTAKNFYAYSFIPGKPLPNIIDTTVFQQILLFCKENLWKRKELTKKEQEEFNDTCRKYYYDNTVEGTQKFFDNTNLKDREEVINGEKVPSVKDLIKKVNWENVNTGTPCLFHGNLKPENIIISQNGFTFVDWQQDFGDNNLCGDLYFDLANLYAALTAPTQIITSNQFEVREESNCVTYNFSLKNNLLKYKQLFEEFITKEGFDLKKVKTLAALLFLNTAALHHQPYSKFLFYLGKHELYNQVKGRKK